MGLKGSATHPWGNYCQKEIMNELALFAGAGGGILGGKLLKWRTVCAVEWEPYPASVLCARQNDGLLPPFPIWDDVRTFDAKPWRGIVDVVSGGFPCQDISAAGKGDGLDGERSSMWFEMARVVSEARPRYVFVENSPMLTTRGGVRVVADLAKMGYDCRWTVMGAADVGANHQRDRMWIVARRREVLSHTEHNRTGWGEQQSQGIENETREVYYPNSIRLQRPTNECVLESQGSNQLQTEQPRNTSELADTQNEGYVRWFGSMGATESQHNHRGSQSYGCRQWWQTEPDVGRVVDGMADRVDRLKAIGNGQVPLCAATAWRLLTS
jgi:DNA (cytosine-5)-methyltransferase 1